MADDPIEELLGAYVLDALDEHERRQVESYLEANPRARAEVQQLREVTAMLSVSSERPPEGLWDRISGALEEAPPAPGPALAQVLPHEPRRRRTRSTLAAVGGALVAAAAAVAITLVVVRDDGSGGSDDVIAAAYDEALADPSGRRTQLQSEDGSVTADAVVTADGIGYLSAGALPPLPDDETYQLWGVYGDDDVISLGVMGNRPDIEPFTAADDVVALVLTREQAGGVVSSQNPALAVGEL
jgi:anti-sigma-K factor RskA